MASWMTTKQFVEGLGHLKPGSWLPEAFTFTGVIGNATVTQPNPQQRTVLFGYDFYCTHIIGFSRAIQPFGVGAPGANTMPLLGIGSGAGVNLNDFDPRNHALVTYQVQSGGGNRTNWFVDARNFGELMGMPGASIELPCPRWVAQSEQPVVTLGRAAGVWTNNNAAVFTSDLPVGIVLSGVLIKQELVRGA